MNLINDPYGNHLMTGIDRDPKDDPDDFHRCDICGTWVYIDDIADGYCKWCWASEVNEFTCNACQDEFKTVGIPSRCPKCISANIEHSLSRVCSWIREVQEKEERDGKV